MRLACLCALTLLFMAGTVGPAPGQALETVNVGAVNSVADSAFLIADRKGYFRDAGLQVKFITFDSGAAMIAPLGTGQLDVAGGAPAAGLYNAIAAGLNIKVVAERASDTPGYGFNVIMVRKDLVTSGRYKRLSDLKGLKFAEPGKGSTSLAMTAKLLEKAGLKYDDVEHVFLGFPAQVAALQNGSVDATGLLEPWATQASKMGLAVKIMGDDQFYPNQQLAVTLYSSQFAEKRPEMAKKFMVAYLRALRFYADALRGGRLAGPNAAEVIDILADVTKLDPAVLREMTPSGVNPTGHVNVQSLTEDYQTFKKYGLVTADVAIDKLVDMSFVENANRVLGPYRARRR